MKRPLLILASLSALAMLVIGIRQGVKWVIEVPDRQAAARMEQNIQEVLAGRETDIYLSNEISDSNFATFIAHRNDLNTVRNLRLIVEYSHDADRFLQQLSGFEAVRAIIIHASGLSDAGLENLATLPNLNALSIDCGSITDVGFEKLAASPSLKSLRIEPRNIDRLSVQTLISMPHIEALSLSEPPKKSWLKRDTAQLGDATSLRALNLYESDLSPADVDRLRARLQNCVVRAYRDSESREEIAPLPETSPAATPRHD